MMSHKPLLLLAGFLLFTPIIALYDFSQGYEFGESKFGPFGVPTERFNELMESPNATSKYPLAAPNLSAPYPGPGQTDGWYLSVSVVADIPMTESNHSSRIREYPNKTFTGTRVLLRTPTGPDTDIHETWNVCLLEFRMNMTHFPRSLRQDDGSCTSTLNEQCIREVEASVVQRYRASSGSRCGCPDWASVSSGCRDGAAFLREGACISRTFNTTDIKELPDGKFESVWYGGIPHDKGNLTAYNETGSFAWPFLVMFGPSANTTRVSPNGVVEPKPEIPDSAAKLFCLRAKDATEGSIAPGIGGTSGARKLAGVPSMVFVTGLLVWGVLAIL